jgi:hypothetical protein
VKSTNYEAPRFYYVRSFLDKGPNIIDNISKNTETLIEASNEDEDRLCGLVVEAPDYRPRSPEFDSRRYKNVWEVVGLERDPLSLVRITEVTEWKIV